MTLRLIPYLVLNGTASEAIAFYEQALGAEVLYKQTFGEMPENPEYPLPAEAKISWDMPPSKLARAI